MSVVLWALCLLDLCWLVNFCMCWGSLVVPGRSMPSVGCAIRNYICYAWFVWYLGCSLWFMLYVNAALWQGYNTQAAKHLCDFVLSPPYFDVTPTSIICEAPCACPTGRIRCYTRELLLLTSMSTCLTETFTFPEQKHTSPVCNFMFLFLKLWRSENCLSNEKKTSPFYYFKNITKKTQPILPLAQGLLKLSTCSALVSKCGSLINWFSIKSN